MSLPAAHKLRYKPFQVGPLQQHKTGLIDIFRDLSMYNAKNFPYTTKDGHLLGAYVDVTMKATKDCSGSIVALQNSWKLRNAVRKFHFRRLEMFENAGIEGEELGRYGHEIRPYFDRAHALQQNLWNEGEFGPYRVTTDGVTVDSGTDIATVEIEFMKGGDWDRSQVVSSTPTADGGDPETDVWNLHLAGGHITSATAGTYDSVGMILAYNEDRMEVVTPGAEETVVGNNPLALLASQSVTGGLAADIAEDQELERPPYDISDGGDSISLSEIEFFRAVPYSAGDDNSAIIHLKNLWLPAGYLGFSFDQFPSDLVGDGLEIVVDVKSVWECRELA